MSDKDRDKVGDASRTTAAKSAAGSSSPAAPSTEERTQTPLAPRGSGATAPAPQSPRSPSVHAGAGAGAEPGGQSRTGEGGDRTSQPERKATAVRVLVDNLGPKRYRKGEVVDDPEIVALLDDGTGRVGRVEVC